MSTIIIPDDIFNKLKLKKSDSFKYLDNTLVYPEHFKKNVDENFFNDITRKKIYILGLSEMICIYDDDSISWYSEYEESIKKIKSNLKINYAILKSGEKKSYFIKLKDKKLIENISFFINSGKKEERVFPKIKQILSLKNYYDLKKEYLLFPNKKKNEYFLKKINDLEENPCGSNDKRKEYIDLLFPLYTSHFVSGLIDGNRKSKHYLLRANPNIIKKTYEIISVITGADKDIDLEGMIRFDFFKPKEYAKLYNFLYKLDWKYTKENNLFLTQKKKKIFNESVKKEKYGRIGINLPIVKLLKTKNITDAEISVLYNCSPFTIQSVRKKFNIETRNPCHKMKRRFDKIELKKDLTSLGFKDYYVNRLINNYLMKGILL